ncbi:MAG: hypothetical protein ACKV19_01795 [Verrucomicrobiales bacterium]
MTHLIQFLACPSCRVDPGSTINQATNGAIFVMLGVMAVVFGGFLAMVIGFVRRQRAIGADQIAGLAQPPPTGTTQSI